MAAWSYDDPASFWQADLSPAELQAMMAQWNGQTPGGRGFINGYGLSRGMDRGPMGDAQDVPPQEVVGSGFISRKLNDGSDYYDVWDENGRYQGRRRDESSTINFRNFLMAAAGVYGVGAYAGAAGAAGAGGAAGSGAAGMTTAEQVAMMAANGMTDAQIAAALGTQGAHAAGLTGVGGGAAAAGAGAAGAGAAAGGAGAAGAAAPAAGGAGAATGLAGAAKTALPWVSAATQLYGTYAQGKAAQDAAAAQQAAAQQGIGEQRRQFDLVQSLLAPYAQAGTKAIGAQADLAGLNGTDAQRAAITALESSPQMAALTKQGETAILQNASATGGLRGGNVQGALATFRPNVLAQLIESQYGRLGGLTSIGQNAAAGTGNAGMLTGNQITNLLTQQGASQAGGALAHGATNAGYAAAIAQLAGMFSGLGQQGPGGTPPIAPTTRGGF